MKVFWRLLMVLSIYVGIVVLFESMIGYFQPANAKTLVISTQASDGSWNDRVVSRVEDQGRLYVAANHWPRAWYRDALEAPEVRIVLDDEPGDYLAVPVVDAEHERLATERAHPFFFRLLTGFPPRRFLRLDPR